jgi:hypothetical protein
VRSRVCSAFRVSMSLICATATRLSTSAWVLIAVSRATKSTRLLGNRLTREEEKSLRLHQALLTQIIAEPDAVISKARENLDRWAGMHRPDGMTARYFEEWKRVLDDGLDTIVDVVISPSPEARELRQNSPFAGVLPAETRLRVLQSFRNHWNREHGRKLAA